ncbi:hypothetical protein SAMN04488587_0809 [Methanococcoides vulcani]|uniref:Uncharacterized protein n=1 Tax=Methanococcoides vulcani TaxID=1353158 RepID=A0A1H9Z292_9EURY|nr:hypothetical protein [Methanococcoides vulcani]SES75481.1 hypothetical protein SAMN04488587_0809 [Methanococcoides vulcani]
MNYKPYRPLKAIGYSLLIWAIGFVCGTVVFMTPALSEIPSIEYVSKMPAISVPLLIASLIVIPYLSKRYLENAVDKIAEATVLGVIFLVINVLLDLLMYLTIYDQDYYTYISIWISYAFILILPMYTGKRMQN